MEAQVSQHISLSDQLALVREKLRNGETNLSEFRETYRLLNKHREELQTLLEWATDQNREDKDLYRFYARLAGENASALVDRLRGYGFTLTNTDKIVHEKNRRDDLKKAFVERQGFRLMELTRAGKKEEVQYQLLRLFWSYQLEFPSYLLEAFKPIYSEELFKVFIFSFLSGVLGKEEQL